MFIGEGKFESLLSKINEEILLEKRRGGYISPSIIEQLEKYKESGRYYMSFSPYMDDGEKYKGGVKLGINPRNKYNTPTGIYSYPIKKMWKNIIKGDIPYAGSNPNIFIFKPKNENKIAYSSSYNMMDLYEDMSTLLKKIHTRL